MYQFIGLLPDYASFRAFFWNVNIDYDNADTTLFYNFVKNRFSTRIFRWGDLEEIRTLCAEHLENAYFQFIHLLNISKLDLENLIANDSSNRIYQLPGSGSEITMENINKHLDNKSLNRSNVAKLSIIAELGNTRIFKSVRDELAQMFISVVV